MKRIAIALGSCLVAIAALTGGLVACNGVLGISSANLGDTTEAGVTCEYYCHEMSLFCSGADTEYQDNQALCLSMCQNLQLDQGTISPSNDNTLGCRIAYAQAAGKGDPGTNCRYAGPLGGGRCGDKSTACSNFCSLDIPYCQSIGKPQYASETECNAICTGVGAGDAGAGYSFVTSGTGTDLPDGTNTLNCRFYHLENAYPSKQAGIAHCPHTAPVSAVCF